MYQHVAPTSEELATLAVRRRAGETGIAPRMIEPDVQGAFPARMPTLEEYERQIQAPNRPSLGIGDYLNPQTATAFISGVTEPFRGAIGDLTGLSPYDYTPAAMTPALMAMGIPYAAEDQYDDKGQWLDTVARYYNYGKAPDEQAPLYHHEPMLDTAARSLQLAGLSGQAAAIGSGAGAIGAGLSAVAPTLAAAAQGTGAVAQGARMLQPVLRAANVAATGLPEVQGAGRLAGAARTAVNETLGNIQPGILAQGSFQGASQIPGALVQTANPLFATMGANYLWNQAAQNAQQAYADKGSLVDAASAGLIGGANALTLEPTARIGNVINLARMGEGFASAVQQQELQKALNSNPALAEAYNSPDPVVREQTRQAVEEALVAKAPGYSTAGGVSSMLGAATAPFRGSTYVADPYIQQRSKAYTEYADQLYSPEVLNEIFAGNLNPPSLARSNESLAARFGPNAAQDPKQLIASNIYPMLEAHRGEVAKRDSNAVPYFDYMLQNFNTQGPTQNNMAILGMFRNANLSNDPAAMRQAMQQAYNVYEVDNMKNQLVSDGK